MFIHRLHYTFHEHLVVAFHFWRCHVVSLFLHVCILSLYTPVAVYEIVYYYLQLFEAERFGEESVGTPFQSFEPVSHFRLRCEQYNRRVAYVRVGFYGAQH